MTSWTGQIIQTWATCKPQKKKNHPHARTGARLFRVERWQHTKALLCCSLRDSQEDREFYQANTVKTHSNNLVVLAHVQFKAFYRLSTRDVTHMRKCTRPFTVLQATGSWAGGWEQGYMHEFYMCYKVMEAE